MLSLQRTSKDSPKLIPNLLPCCVSFNGPVNASERYWDPENKNGNEDGKVAYFRGRKLKSRTIRVKDGYHGVLAKTTDKLLTSSEADLKHNQNSKRIQPEEEDEEEEQEEPTKILEEVAQFDEMQVWGHETVPEEDDLYVRGMEEWIGFAEAMHSYDPIQHGKAS